MVNQALYQKVLNHTQKQEMIDHITLQRRFDISYVEAAALIDVMEEEGFIGSHQEGGRKVIKRLDLI